MNVLRHVSLYQSKLAIDMAPWPRLGAIGVEDSDTVRHYAME